MIIYAVDDIHGQHNQLEGLFDRMPLSPGDVVVFLGAYIDHKGCEGDSRRVVAMLIARAAELERQGIRLVFLRGNHEQMLLNALAGDPPILDADVDQEAHAENPAKFWFRNGGSSTMRDYISDWDALSEEAYRRWWTFIPEAHWAFYKATQLSQTQGPYHFVHAGVEPPKYIWRPANPFHFPAELWLYDKVLKHHPDRFDVGDPPIEGGRILVVGHTSWDGYWPLLQHNLIGVDTGAGNLDSKTDQTGPLTAIRLNPESGIARRRRKRSLFECFP